MTTRIGQVTKKSRFLNWMEHSVQLRKRKRRRCHFINLRFILLGLLRRSFSRDLHFVDDICNYSIAHVVIVLDVEMPNLYMTADANCRFPTFSTPQLLLKGEACALS